MGRFQEKDLVRILNSAEEDQAERAIVRSEPYFAIQGLLINEISEVLEQVIDEFLDYIPLVKANNLVSAILKIVSFALGTIDELEIDAGGFLTQEEEGQYWKDLYEDTKQELGKVTLQVEKLQKRVQALQKFKNNFSVAKKKYFKDLDSNVYAPDWVEVSTAKSFFNNRF